MNRPTYKLIKFLIRVFTKKPTVFGDHHVVKGTPALLMASHARFYGPIAISCYTLHITDKIWANSMVIDTKESMEYTTRTLFKETLGWRDFPAKIAGGFVGWVMSGLMQNEDLITAYWDAGRARQSIVAGVKAVADGKNQLMYARNVNEIDGKLDESFDFEKGYQLVMHQALKRLGVAVTLHPVAINKNKHTVAIGPAIKIDKEKPLAQEKQRINDYLVKAVKLGYHSPQKLADLKRASEI